MKDLRTIVEAYKATDVRARFVALATVVRVHGSSYRSPGARMLITDDGKWVGSISGGCLEGDALRKARQVMVDRKPCTITYDTREESNQHLGIGLGCNGVIDVFIEPIHPEDPNNVIQLFSSLLDQAAPVSLATFFSGKATGKKILGITPLPLAEIAGDFLHVYADLEKTSATGKSEVHTYPQGEAFVELLQPPVTLIIFGGGFDARPVCELAKTLGWTVQVTDECVAHIAPVFFPSADSLSLCQRQQIDRNFTITEYTACVLMSHNYEYDRDVLKKIIKTPTPYIGVLGPKKRFDRMREELHSEGIRLEGTDLQRIHAPIGLDLGAETPDEIALSIIAEIQAKFNNRSGGFLKYRNNPIHHRDTDTDQIFKHVMLGNDRHSKSVNG